MAIAKGELVFATGDPTRGLFLVEEGLVRLMRHGIDGDDVTLHVAGPGEMFAEASLFAERYHCDAIAERPTTLLTFAKARVLAMLETEPRSARRWIEHLSRQVQSLRAQTALLGLKTAADRVLSYLRLRAGKGVVVPIDRPWKVIASELGLTHEALYRALARLERDGVIVRDRKRFLVGLRPDRSRRSS
ncbi:MAG: Crp/Fnr family transcriptional regulator [Alphaproteobacteria bacterium]